MTYSPSFGWLTKADKLKLWLDLNIHLDPNQLLWNEMVCISSNIFHFIFLLKQDKWTGGEFIQLLIYTVCVFVILISYLQKCEIKSLWFQLTVLKPKLVSFICKSISPNDVTCADQWSSLPMGERVLILLRLHQRTWYDSLNQHNQSKAGITLKTTSKSFRCYKELKICTEWPSRKKEIYRDKIRNNIWSHDRSNVICIIYSTHRMYLQYYASASPIRLHRSTPLTFKDLIDIDKSLSSILNQSSSFSSINSSQMDRQVENVIYDMGKFMPKLFGIEDHSPWLLLYLFI